MLGIPTEQIAEAVNYVFALRNAQKRERERKQIYFSATVLSIDAKFLFQVYIRENFMGL